jgi:hypothetical protein
VGCTPRQGGRRPVAVVGVSGPAVGNADGKAADDNGVAGVAERFLLCRDAERMVPDRGEGASLPAKLMDGGRA